MNTIDILFTVTYGNEALKGGYSLAYLIRKAEQEFRTQSGVTYVHAREIKGIRD